MATNDAAPGRDAAPEDVGPDTGTEAQAPVGPDADGREPDSSAAGGSAAGGSAAGNPFSDLRAGDLVRDAVAVTLLLLSFGMPWDFYDTSTGRLYVVFATLLSIASVALPYLRRGGILPASWTDRTVRVSRLVANVPYAVVVVVTLVLGYVGSGGPGGGDGIGIGVAFGLAGAVLAAQPRTSERSSETGDAELWRLTVGVLAALIAVLTVVSLVFVLVDSEGADWADIAYIVLYMLFFAVVALIPASRLLRGGGPARDVLVVLGAVGLLAGFWLLGAESGSGVWSLRYSGPVIAFWPALAAAASAASLPSVLSSEAGSRRWITLALRLFRLAVVATGFAALLAAVAIARDETGRGTEITLLVVLLLALVAALVGRNALAADARTGRPTALVAAGAFVIVGIVYAAVAANADTGFDTLAAVVVSILFVFAGGIVYALLGPAQVREDLGPVGAVSPSFLRSRTADAAPGHTADPAHDAAQSAAARRADPNDPEATVLAEGLLDDVARGAERPATSARASTIGPDDVTRVDVWVDPQATAVSSSTPAAGGPSAAPDPAGRYTPQQAADPATPLQVLADIAGSEPRLRPYVAANPSAYPELLTWLAQLGDPAVDDALRRRRS